MDARLEVYNDKMAKALAHLEGDYQTIRAGRANPGVLDKIQVDYYGVPTPINQMAAVSVPDARTLMIQPWDASTLKAIEKAINESDIGINPNTDGKAIRLSFPPLTEERRKDLAKEIRKYGEDAKVAVRNSRRDAIDKIKAMLKAKEITEDDVKDGEKDAQKSTDKYCDEIDKMISAKEKEIMEL